MKSFLLLLVLAAPIFMAGCGGRSESTPSSAGALTANASFSTTAPTRFGNRSLAGAGATYLNEYIRPEVRARLDQEPAGDADADFDPATLDPPSVSDPVESDQTTGENVGEEAEQQQRSVVSDDDHPGVSRLDTVKFAWASRKFGDTINAVPTNYGVIVLYADENYYDLDRLIAYIEEGRDRIASASGLEGDRIQVVFGGYRAAPQVELWIVPERGLLPELKPEERPKSPA